MFSTFGRTIQINVNIRLLFKGLLFSLLHYRNSRLVLFLFGFEAEKIWPQVKLLNLEEFLKDIFKHGELTTQILFISSPNIQSNHQQM